MCDWLSIKTRRNLLVLWSLLLLLMSAFLLTLHSMDRIIGIDYGRKRVGVAVSDPLGIFASALETVQTAKIIEYLKKYAENEKVVRFVVGYPMNMDGAPSEAAKDVDVFLTIDRPQEGWDGNVGFVPTYLRELAFDTNRIAVLCGPPIMIKFTLEGLCALGFDKTQIYTTLELRMKCGVGKCGRCNVGAKYVCKDGPVFRCDELDELPGEY